VRLQKKPLVKGAKGVAEAVIVLLLLPLSDVAAAREANYFESREATLCASPPARKPTESGKVNSP
jgi:hypothetical protein